MKAKAMKKTLSCILALTLTASMMSESLTSFAALDEGVAQELPVDVPDAPEEDEAASTTPIKEADKIAIDLLPDATTGTNADLVNELGDEAGTKYLITEARIVDKYGNAITKAQNLFTDEAKNADVTYVDVSVLKGYYVEVTINKVTGTTGAGVVSAEGVKRYVTLESFVKDSAGTAAAGVTASKSVFRDEGDTEDIVFPGDETSFTDGVEGRVTIGLPRTNYDNMESIAPGDTLRANMTATFFAKGLTDLTFSSATVTGYAGETIASILGRNKVKATRVYNDGTESDVEINLTTKDSAIVNGKLVYNYTFNAADKPNDGDKITMKIGDAAKLGTEVVATETGTYNIEVTLDPALTTDVNSVGTIAVKVEKDAASAITILDDENVGSAAAPVKEYKTGEPFELDAAVLLVEHKNGTAQYLVSIPDIEQNTDTKNIKKGTVKWYAIAANDTNRPKLKAYIDAVKAYNTAIADAFEANPDIDEDGLIDAGSTTLGGVKTAATTLVGETAALTTTLTADEIEAGKIAGVTEGNILITFENSKTGDAVPVTVKYLGVEYSTTVKVEADTVKAVTAKFTDAKTTSLTLPAGTALSESIAVGDITINFVYKAGGVSEDIDLATALKAGTITATKVPQAGDTELSFKYTGAGSETGFNFKIVGKSVDPDADKNEINLYQADGETLGDFTVVENAINIEAKFGDKAKKIYYAGENITQGTNDITITRKDGVGKTVETLTLDDIIKDKAGDKKLKWDYEFLNTKAKADAYNKANSTSYSVGALIIKYTGGTGAITKIDLPVVNDYVKSITIDTSKISEVYFGDYLGTTANISLDDAVAGALKDATVTITLASGRTSQAISGENAFDADKAAKTIAFANTADAQESTVAQLGKFSYETKADKTKAGTITYTLKFEDAALKAKSIEQDINTTFDIDAKKIFVDSIEVFNGAAISDTDYYVADNPVDTVTKASAYKPNTEYYVGEEVNKNNLTRGFTVGNRAALSDGKGAILVNFSNKKKAVVLINDATADFAVTDVDTSTAKETSVRITLKTGTKKDQNEDEDSCVLKLNIKADQLNALAWATSTEKAGQILPVFYAGDTTFDVERFAYDKVGGERKAGVHLYKELLDGDGLYIKATYENAGEVYLDLLKSENLAKFTILDFETKVARTSKNKVEITLVSKENPDLEVKVPIWVAALVPEWTLVPPTQTQYQNGDTISFAGGYVEETYPGQNGKTSQLSIADLIEGTKYPNYDVDINDKRTKAGDGDVIYTITWYETSDVTSGIEVGTFTNSFVTNYIKSAEFTAPTEAKQFTGTALDFGTLSVTGTGTDGDTTKFDLTALCIAPFDATPDVVYDMISTQTGLIKKGNKNGYFAKSYITVTHVDAKTEKVVNSNINALTAGKHTVTIHIGDWSASYVLTVEDVKPTKLTIADGKTEYQTKDVNGNLGTKVKPAAPVIAGEHEDEDGNIYVGSTLVVADSTFNLVVEYNDGHIAIFDQASLPANAKVTFTGYDKDTVGEQTIKLVYTETIGTDNTEVSVQGDVKVKVIEDAPESFAILKGKAAVSAGNKLQFYVGDDFSFVPTIKENDKVTAVITWESGATSKLDLTKADILKDFKVQGFSTATAGTGKDATVKYGTLKGAITIYYDVVQDTPAITTAAGHKAIAKSVLEDSFTAKDIDLTGAVIDIDFANPAKTDVKNLAVSEAAKKDGYVVSLYDSSNAVAIADIFDADDEDFDALTPGAYKIKIQYVEEAIVLGGEPGVKSNELEIGTLTIEGESAYVTDFAITTAPTYNNGNGVVMRPGDDNATKSTKAKFFIECYKYATPEALADALKNPNNDLEFSVTYKDGTTKEKVNANDAAVTYDTTAINTAKAGDYTLTIQIGEVKKTVAVNIPALKATDPAVTIDTANVRTAFGLGEQVYGFGKSDAKAKITYKVGTGVAKDAVTDIDAALAQGKDNVSVSGFTTASETTSGAGKIVWGDKTKDITYSVVKGTLAEVKFIEMPTKTEYLTGEAISLTGGVAIAKFSATGVNGYDDEALIKILNGNPGKEPIYNSLTDAYWAVLDLSKLGDLDIDVNGKLTIGKYDGEELAGAIHADNVTGKAFEEIVKTPQSIKFTTEPTKTYWLAYKNKQGKTVFAATEKTAGVNDVFDLETGALEVSYLGDSAKNTITFTKGDDTRITGAGAANGKVYIKIGDEDPAAVPAIPTTKGTYTASVVYQEADGLTAQTEYTVEVKEDAIKSIKVSDPTKTSYLVGEKFDRSGAKVSFEMLSGRKVDDLSLIDTAKFKISDEDMTMSEVGEKTIKIDYVEKDKDSLKDVVVASYSIKVTVEESVPEKIEIGHRPKILYSTAESALDLTDGTLKVTYKTSDGTSVVEIPLDSEGITIEKPNFNNEGPQSLKVTYLGQTTTLNIIVEKDELEGIVNSEIDPISATVAPATKLEDFVKNGSISVKYSIREPKEVKLSDKSISISGWDETATDKISIKITYTENGMSKSLDFVVTVSNIKIKSLTPEKTKLVYIVNSANTLKADLDKINVTIAYDDADTKDDTTTLADTQKLAYVIKDSADAVVDIDKVDLTKVGTYTVVISSAVEKDSTVTGTITLSVENLSVKSIKATAPAVRVPVKGTFSPADQEVTIAYTNEGAESKTVKLGNTEYITYTIKDAAGKTVEAINTDAAAVYTIYAASVEDTAFKAAEVITVTVSDLEIDKITLTPDSVKVKKNGKIDLSGVKAMVSYKDGKADNKEFDLGTDAAEFVIDTDPVKIDTVGEYKVTVIPKADPTKTATLTINVYDVSVKDIIVTPTTLTLKKAESITPEALLQAIKDYVATVTYSDGTTETLNVAAEYGKTLTVDFSAVKINEVGSYDVAVALKADPAKTAKVTVVVTEKTITKFELNTTAIEVKTGDTADYSKKYEAVKVNVTYVEADKTTTDSIALNADDARIAVESNVDITKAGEYKVTVTSREDASKTATLTVKVVDGNKISDEDVEDIPEETPTKEDAVVVFTKSGDEWTSETGYASLSAALDSKSGIGKGTGDYMFVINKDVTEAKAVKFPSKATGITIVGDGTLTLSKATTINIKTANVSINCKINGDLNVTVGAGKTLKVGEKTGKLGKVTGNKSGTSLDVFGSVTIGSLSTFSKVYAEDGSIITIPAKGKVQNIADLKAEMILDGSVTVTGTTVNEGILHLTKNGTAKQPIAKVTLAGETKTFLDIIVGDEDTAIEGGMKVLYGSGKFNAAKNVNIINKDAQGNDLGAVAYNNNKEVRAENTEAITYQIGEGDEQNTSSFEALFNALANETGDVTVTVNSDAVISKANLPKKLASLTIKGASDDITITSNLTSIKVAYKLAFEDINIVAKNAKGADAALTISTTGSEMSFTNTTIIGKSITLAGNKKATTLKISDLNCVDKIQNFAVVEVTGLAGVAKTFTAETLKLGDDAFISFGNGCAVKITKLSGAGTIGLAKAATAKKFKAITLTSTDITEEGAVELVQIEFKATDSKALYGAVVEGTFETGTVIFADKSKGAIAYDKIFDATGLKDEGKLTNTKGKVTLG